MSNILALDLSTKSSGWAVKTQEIELESGIITSASQSIEKRIGIMRDGVIELVKKYNIDIVVVEEVHAEYTHNSQVNQKLNWLQGCIRVALWEYNNKIKIETMLPNVWRSKIGIHTGRGVTRDVLKQKDIEYAFNNYSKKVSDDEADAICLCDAYLKGAEKVSTEIKKIEPINSRKSAF